MNFPPAVVDEMSLWEFAACVDGWNRSQGAETVPPPMSDDEFEAMKSRYVH